MRPDSTDRFPGRDDTVVPIDGALTGDPELTALEAELERAGTRARAARAADGRQRPAPVFAGALRTRLVSQLPSVPAQAAAGPATLPHPAGRPLRPPTWRPAPPTEAIHAAVAVPVRVAPRTPTILPAPRWTAFAIAAAVILAVVGIRGSVELPVAPSTRASDVAGATLLRAGSTSALGEGTALREGDEIDVASGGHATIHLGASEARLSGDASVRIVSLTGEVVLDQLAGRAYHRVAVGADERYVVQTAGLSWTAQGTAFDLDRSRIDGGERLELLAVEHEVALDGPGLHATVAEGRRAIVLLAALASDVSLSGADPASLRDPWLLANARLDLASGFGVGVLAGLDLAEGPTPTPPDAWTPVPTLEPPPSPEPVPNPDVTPSAAPSSESTPQPTPRSTPRPTPKPTVRPTPTPGPVTLALSVASCSGGIVLDWSPYGGARFSHYGVVRSSSPSIPVAWPPSGEASVVAGTTTTDRSRTSAADSGADGAPTFYYRALAVDASNRVLGASAVRSGSPQGVASLGELTVGAIDGGTSFGWTPLDTPAACFSAYKLVYAADDSSPSYLTGATLAWAGSDPTASGTFLTDLPSGTYWFRVQALRLTDLGRFVVAESTAISYTVP